MGHVYGNDARTEISRTNRIRIFGILIIPFLFFTSFYLNFTAVQYTAISAVPLITIAVINRRFTTAPAPISSAFSTILFNAISLDETAKQPV